MNKDGLKGKLQDFPDLINEHESLCNGKEHTTKAVLIEPFLESIGVPIRDPKFFHREDTTITNKRCDYAYLKEVGKDPIILIEAKPIDNPLTNKKELDQLDPDRRPNLNISGHLSFRAIFNT